MTRIRTIKPEIVQDVRLARCSIEARYLYVLLITQADDYGRLHGAPGAIRGACLPLDDVGLTEVHEWLIELHDVGLIARYLVAEQEYVALTGWSKNQRVDKPGVERIPPPESGDTRPFGEPSRESRESVARPPAPDIGTGGGTGRGRGKGNRENGSSSCPTPAAPDADSIAECEHLAALIERNGSKRPTVTAAWLLAADRMRRLDGRTHDQIIRAIDWCQADEFWRANVLSMPKLREKYDQLRLAAARPAGRSDQHSINHEIRRRIAEGGQA